MHDDLLFHVTTRDDWQEHKNSGNYEPESLDTQGFIHCSSGHQVEDTANKHFADKEQILLLVIDVAMVREQIKYEEDKNGEKFPHIYGPLSINAVIDQIDVAAEENGKFNIAFTSDS